MTDEPCTELDPQLSGPDASAFGFGKGETFSQTRWRFGP